MKWTSGCKDASLQHHLATLLRGLLLVLCKEATFGKFTFRWVGDTRTENRWIQRIMLCSNTWLQRCPVTCTHKAQTAEVFGWNVKCGAIAYGLELNLWWLWSFEGSNINQDLVSWLRGFLHESFCFLWCKTMQDSKDSYKLQEHQELQVVKSFWELCGLEWRQFALAPKWVVQKLVVVVSWAPYHGLLEWYASRGPCTSVCAIAWSSSFFTRHAAWGVNLRGVYMQSFCQPPALQSRNTWQAIMIVLVMFTRVNDRAESTDELTKCFFGLFWWLCYWLSVNLIPYSGKSRFKRPVFNQELHEHPEAQRNCECIFARYGHAHSWNLWCECFLCWHSQLVTCGSKSLRAFVIAPPIPHAEQPEEANFNQDQTELCHFEVVWALGAVVAMQLSAQLWAKLQRKLGLCQNLTIWM